MKRIGFITLALVALATSLFAFRGSQPASAQQAPKPILGKTILEGMALDEEGEPLFKHSGWLRISILDAHSEEVFSSGGFPSNMGGLYRFEVKPGVYDIYVTVAGGIKLSPLRLNGVLIKGGKTTRLNITMHKGEMLEVIGKPVTDAEPAFIISEQFEKMQKVIDDLKKQVEELKKK